MNDKANQSAAQATTPKKAPDAGGGETFPVARLRFTTPVDVPGKAGANALNAGPGDSGSYEIDYIPRIRHHRITFTPRAASSATEVLMVHESAASWKPGE